MGLEEDIGQTRPFNSVYEKALVNILFTHGWVMDILRNFFKEFELTPKQYNILRILRGARGPLSISSIKVKVLDKTSDVSRIVDRLILKGMVIKSPSEEDKRKMHITITPAGLSVLNDIEKSEFGSDFLCKGLEKAEAVQLSYLMDKMRSRCPDIPFIEG